MEEQDNIGRLFREKLEFAEVIPSGSLRDNLMRQTARKEFLRFNPARINIYYITLLLAAAAAALVLIANSARQEKVSPPVPGGDTSRIQPVPDQPVTTAKPLPVMRSGSVNIPDNKNNIILPANPEDSAVAEPEYTTSYKSPVIGQSPVKKVSSIKGLFDGGKSGNDKELRGLISLPEGFIQSTAKEGCAPLKIKFSCSPGDYQSYKWSFGNGGSSELKDPEWTFASEGEYRISLVVRRSDGIRLTSFTDIKVNPRPLARFEVRPDEDGSGETKFINYSLNASRFRWSFGDGSTSEIFEPAYSYSRPGNYRVNLVAISDLGCSDTLTVVNTFTGNNYFINFPNAFIPNPGGPTGGFYSTKSDESAQVFHPVYSGVAEYRLRIFSKIGVLIFETDDISVGWDGYFKGQLSEPGVYVWKVMGSYVNGEPFIKSGDVTILKAER